MRPSERQTTWCLTIVQVSKTKKWRRRNTVIAGSMYMELGKLIVVSMQAELATYSTVEDSRVKPNAQRATIPWWCD